MKWQSQRPSLPASPPALRSPHQCLQSVGGYILVLDIALFKIGHDDEGSDQDGNSHLNHGDVIGAVPDGQGVHTQLLFHKADKVAGGEQSNYHHVSWS